MKKNPQHECLPPPEAFCHNCKWLVGSKYTCSKRAKFLESTYKMTENQAICSLFDQGVCIYPSYSAAKDVTVKKEMVDNQTTYNNTSSTQENIGSTDKVATAVESFENNINNMTVVDDANTAYSSNALLLQCILLIILIASIILLIRKRMRNNNSLLKKEIRTCKVCIILPKIYFFCTLN